MQNNLPSRILHPSSFLLLLLTTFTLAATTQPATRPASSPATTTAPANELPVKFVTLETKAARIVYILDHSGSMLDTFDFLRKATTDSINGLTAEQAFNVIMVSQDAKPLFPKLQPATADCKKDVIKKLENFRAQGMSDDLLEPFEPAFKAAFQQKPDTIIFQTDGHFDPRIADTIKRLNRTQKIRMHTIAFINRDPSLEERLQKIAKDNNGQYKFISEKDLAATQPAPKP